MSKTLWSLIFQFKTFAIAATHRTLTPGLQLKDRNFLTGSIALVGLGAMVDGIRRYQLEDNRDQEFGDWLTSAIERGGLLGIVSDLNQTLETLSDNRFGIRPLLGVENSYSRSNLSKVGSVGGPIVQQSANVARVLWDLGPGEANARTADSARRIMYGGKMFWADGLYDTVEDGMKSAIGE